jgi:dihydrofolate reductase
MRLVATEYVSLDGVFEEPGRWSGPWFDEQAAGFKWEELQASDALLLGRVTYEGFAAAWPTFSDAVGFADKMNTMPKFVVSSTLDKAEWTGSEILGPDLLAEIERLKGQPGGDLLLSGSGQLFRALMTADAIDRYRLMVHPVVLGDGRRLFADDADRRPMRLVSTTSFAAGIVILEYDRAA